MKSFVSPTVVSVVLGFVLLNGSRSSAVPGQSKENHEKSRSQTIRATGCVRAGVEGGCLLLTTLDGKTTYNIFTGRKPPIDAVIEIIAKRHEGPTACMEGMAVNVIEWTQLKSKCPQHSKNSNC